MERHSLCVYGVFTCVCANLCVCVLERKEEGGTERGKWGEAGVLVFSASGYLTERAESGEERTNLLGGNYLKPEGTKGKAEVKKKKKREEKKVVFYYRTGGLTNRNVAGKCSLIK